MDDYPKIVRIEKVPVKDFGTRCVWCNKRKSDRQLYIQAMKNIDFHWKYWVHQSCIERSPSTAALLDAAMEYEYKYPTEGKSRKYDVYDYKCHEEYKLERKNARNYQNLTRRMNEEIQAILDEEDLWENA